VVASPPLPPTAPPQASSKQVHLIRAVYRVFEKDELNGIHPKQLAHFGQFMMKDWVVTTGGDGYIVDGDAMDGSGSISQHVFSRFCGRRLGHIDDSLVQSLGRGFLAANRGSAWRKKILNGIFRVLCSSNGDTIMESELLHFGKCLDKKFSVEDNEMCMERMAASRTKNVRIEMAIEP